MGYYASNSSALPPLEHASDARPAPAGMSRPLPGGIHDAQPWLERSELLVGKQGMLALARAHVLVVGLGGVGSFAAEFLARAGVGELTIVDGDDVDPTNRNRQLPALVSTQRRMKAHVMKERLLDINPSLKCHDKVQFIECDECSALVQHGKFYLCACVFVRVRVCSCVCDRYLCSHGIIVRTCTYINMYAHRHLQIHGVILSVFLSVGVCLSACLHVCMHACKHVCVCVCVCVHGFHIHTYIYIYRQF